MPNLVGLSWGDWLGTGEVATQCVDIDLSGKRERLCAASV